MVNIIINVLNSENSHRDMEKNVDVDVFYYYSIHNLHLIHPLKWHAWANELHSMCFFFSFGLLVVGRFFGHIIKYHPSYAFACIAINDCCVMMLNLFSLLSISLNLTFYLSILHAQLSRYSVECMCVHVNKTRAKCCYVGDQDLFFGLSVQYYVRFGTHSY